MVALVTETLSTRLLGRTVGNVLTRAHALARKVPTAGIAIDLDVLVGVASIVR